MGGYILAKIYMTNKTRVYPGFGSSEPFLLPGFMGYRVIYIEKCEYLRLYLDNLKVEIKNDALLIPISDIQIFSQI